MRDIYINSINNLLFDYEGKEVKVDRSVIAGDDGLVFLITADKQFYRLKWNKRTSQVEGIKKKDMSEELLKQQVVVGLIYNKYSDTILVVLKDGGLYSLDLDTFEFEMLGDQESGFLAAETSPCGELMVFVTGLNTVVMFDKEMNIVDEKELDDSSKGEDDDLKIKDATIQWRNDSNYFSVNYSIRGGRKCITKDKYLTTFISPAKPDGEEAEKIIVKSLSYTPLDNLGSASGWLTNGSLALVPAVEDGKKFIYLWERNGLRRGEFELPPVLKDGEGNDVDFEVLNIQSNKNSRIVALSIKDAKGGSQVLLYTRSNYHWYRKNVLYFQRDIAGISFSKRNPSLLTVLFKNGDLSLNYLNFDYRVGSYSTETGVHNSLPCMVDLNKIGVSPFSKRVFPPPMSMFNLEGDGQVVSLCFDLNMIVFFTVSKLGKFTINVVEYKYEKGYTTSKIVVQRDISGFSNPGLLKTETGYQLTFVEYTEGKTTVRKEELVKQEDSWTLKKDGEVISPGDAVVYKVVKFEDELSYLDYSNKPTFPDNNTSFDELTFKQRANKIVAIKKEDGEYDVYSLLSNDFLMKNNICLSKNCTSFLVHQGFLLFTSMTQTMYDQLTLYPLSKLVNISREIDEPQYLSNKKLKKNHYYRNVERGAILVCASDQRVVLQHPRGNLETIYPKLLVFWALKTNIIEKQNFVQAYKEIRRHKLDMNLWIDISLPLFQEFLTSGRFIKEFRKIDYINLVLNTLKNGLSPYLKYIFTEDEIKKMNTQLTEIVGESKVDFICNILREALVKDKEYYILSIVMTYAKKVKPQLKEALDMIKELADQEDEYVRVIRPPHLSSNTEKAVTSKKINSKKVLSYLCWITDSNKLYEVALMTYNLDLAIMVAESTQKDPKEYIPYIASLNKIDNEIDRKFKICFDTKNFEQGISELSKGTPEQIEKSLVIAFDKNLFREVSNVYKGNHGINKRIKLQLGEHLYSVKLYKQAGPMLRFGGDLGKALICFEKTLDWEAGLYLMQSQPTVYTQEKINEFLQKMKDEYASKKLYKEAANILKQVPNYDQNEHCMLAVIKGNSFKELKRLTLNYDDHKEFLEEHIIPKLELQAEIELTKYSEKIKDFNKKKARMLVVQELKKNHQFFKFGEGEGADFDTKSEYSYSSKGSSKFSLVTGASGMSKRTKRPKNLLRRKVKEGSMYEEEYIVETLNAEIFSDDSKNDLKHFLDCLVLYGYEDYAVKIIEVTGEYEKTIKKKGRYYKTIDQFEFEKQHQEIYEIFGHLPDFKIMYEVKKNKKKKKDPLAKFDFLQPIDEK